MDDTPGDDHPQDPYGQPQDPYGRPQQPYGPPPNEAPGAPTYGYPASGEQQYGQPGQGHPQAYGQGYPPGGYYVPDHPKATTCLVLGILGIVVCGIAAPFAWQMGKRTVAEIDASNGQLGGRGSAQAGYVLGLIGSILLGLALVFGLLVVVILVIGGIASTTA